MAGRRDQHARQPGPHSLRPAGGIGLACVPRALALSPDGKRLLVSGKTSEVLVIDVEQGKVVQRVALPGEDQEQPPTVVSPNILHPDRTGASQLYGIDLLT